MQEDDTAAFEALLHGFRALDEARAARGDRSPLTWRGLRQAVGVYFAVSGPEPPQATDPYAPAPSTAP
jgi:hypothetical protein